MRAYVSGYSAHNSKLSVVSSGQNTSSRALGGENVVQSLFDVAKKRVNQILLHNFLCIFAYFFRFTIVLCY